MADTSIEWAESVWNATTGCDKVSPGCGLPRPGSDDETTGRTGGCYAMTMARRLKGMGQGKYQNDGDPRTSGPGFGLTVHPDALEIPLRWRKPRRVFVNSMSDLFHDKVDAGFIAQVFGIMAATPRHTYLVLTKRHARLRSLLNNPDFRQVVYEYAWGYDRAGVFDPYRYAPADHIPVDYSRPPYPADGSDWWPLPNVHVGVSVESQKWADIRIPALLDTPAAVRWVSAEPLLGPLDLVNYLTGNTADPTVTGLDWVVAGGESGPGARPMHIDWVRDLRDQCEASGTAFFMKQFGSYGLVDGLPHRGDLWVSIDGSSRPYGTGDGRSRSGLGEWRNGDAVLVRNVGKKAAGRLLDGRTWDEYPEPATAVTR